YPDVRLPSPEISYEVFQANHSIQNEESFENPSNEIAISKLNEEKEEPSQDSDIHQLVEECSTEIYEEQKQKQPAERENHSIQSLQNFRVVHKSSISFRNTSQISSIHAIASVLSTKEPEHLLSMGYEHLSITPETESDEVTESNFENLLPIPSECEVTLEDKRECDVPFFEKFPVFDNSDTFFDPKIDDDILVYDDEFEDIEYVEASLPDPEIVSEEENGVEEENVVQQEEEEEEEEEIDLKGISQIQDVVLREKLLSIIRLISNIESLNDNSNPDRVLNSFESDNSLSDNFSPEFETFRDHSEETRSGNTTHADNSLPEYDSFCFEIEPDQERLINLMKNDNSSNDSLLEEDDLFLSTNLIPSGIENVADDPEGASDFWKNYLSMIPFFLMSHLILILRITCQFHDLLQNRQILKLMQEKRF
nr:hypothetical protein [Tanacetum cinerariifolium]